MLQCRKKKKRVLVTANCFLLINEKKQDMKRAREGTENTNDYISKS